MQLVIGRIAKAHGIGGEVSVDIRTDDPDHRYSLGATLLTDPAERGPLTVQRTRWHTGRLLVCFEGVTDRNAAEALRGTLLVADSATSPATSEADAYWDHELVGLTVVLADGLEIGPEIGTVIDVLHPPGPPVLVVRRDGATEALIPFVAEIVPTVDLATGRLAVDPPEGLLEL